MAANSASENCTKRAASMCANCCFSTSMYAHDFLKASLSASRSAVKLAKRRAAAGRALLLSAAAVEGSPVDLPVDARMSFNWVSSSAILAFACAKALSRAVSLPSADAADLAASRDRDCTACNSWRVAAASAFAACLGRGQAMGGKLVT